MRRTLPQIVVEPAVIDQTFQSRPLREATALLASDTEQRMNEVLARLHARGAQDFVGTRIGAVQQMRGVLDIFRKAIRREPQSYAKSEARLKIMSLETTLARVEKMSFTEWAESGTPELSNAIARLGRGV